MIFGANFKTFITFTLAIFLALQLPLIAAWTIGGLAMAYAFFSIGRLEGAPNGRPLAEKPPVWLRSAKAYGLLGITGFFTSITMGRTAQLLELAPRSSELATVIMLTAVTGIMAFAGIMMSNLLKGQALHSQKLADEEAARAAGNGPKCTCTRKCGMC